ncbi:ubiquinol oxidase subunit II [Collimonas sp.]|jgi:cytochrome o ubiquinol oxidase subunit 2|uniref:ubiquinol oxidase subunit II n=1 Tax=Collimonas sp. TaxID=1963772 RepID=UPI002B595A44|nr:ubiquinol oxidase subunit II [Collimonas sp.]HWW04683.1 ubiquinol oxidase subunit II [Collimonas sp.]
MVSLIFRRGLLLLPLILLAGCDTVLMNPSGDVASQQGHLIVVSTILMLLIIVPVIALTIWFAWRYRKNNTAARYEPDWDHSTQLELVIWGAPLLIIIALGLITWISTHTLDPYRPLSRLDANRPIPADTKTLTVEVVALDWKWLFIYPEQGIATVNELAAPVDVPIRFKITSSAIMNSFFIPALAGQIYAMPGMQTSLNAVINRPGEFDGFSANYSGAGFSDMKFKFHGMTAENFEHWVQTAKAASGKLERADYLQLEKPSQKEPVRYYGAVDPSLYHAILNRCIEPGQMCMDQMMAADGGHSMNMAEEQSEHKAQHHDAHHE